MKGIAPSVIPIMPIIILPFPVSANALENFDFLMNVAKPYPSGGITIAQFTNIAGR